MSRILVGLFIALLVGTSLAYVLPSESDPLAEFIQADGSLKFADGAFTPALQQLLFGSGPEPYISETVWLIDSSGYPTALYRAETFTRPNPNVYTRSAPSAAPPFLPSDVLKPVVDAVRYVFSFDWLVGTASAVDRFAVYGDAECAGTPNPTNLATDLDCWSTTTGGNGDGLPVAGDNLVFDASSGAGTGTMDASLDITTGTINTTGFTGTFALATFIVTNTGTITHDGGTITSGTGGLDGGAMTMSSGVPTAIVTVTGAGVWRLNSLTIQAGGTFTADAATITMDGNWDSSAGTFTAGTSTVVFAVSGNVNANNASTAVKFYNLTINALVTLTNTMPTSTNFYLYIGGLLTVNGTLLGGSPNDPQKIFLVGSALATPVVLGGSADIDFSGYFLYLYRGACGGSQNVTAGVYQHLSVQGGTSTCAVTYNLAGNISTPSCGVYNECAIIVNSEATGTPADNFVFNTGNFSITAGGTFWIGDGGTFGVTLNAGSSAITGYGISPIGDNVVVNWQTATITARPSSSETNLCHYTVGTVILNFNTSTFNCYGQFRLNSGIMNANSATINVNDDDCGAADCGTDVLGSASPGEVVIIAGARINFGSSAWTVESLWQNNNTSAQADWDAGTATVTFSHIGVNTNYNFGGTVLGEAEFFNVTFNSQQAVTFSFTMVTDGIWVGNNFTITDGTSTTEMDTLGLPVRVDGALTIGNGGILTANASTVVVDDVTMTGGTSGTLTITTGAWTVSGNWDTSGTGSTFTQGTSTVTMSGASRTINMLSTDNDYSTLIITGTITLLSGMDATTIQVNSGSFNVGTNDISFVTFETNVENGFIMDEITIAHIMTMTVSVGTILLTMWTLYTHGTSTTDVQWTMNPSDAGAAITVTLSDAQTDRDYELLRDSGVISTDSDRNATISFTVTGGWSPHSMQIVNVSVLPQGDDKGQPFIEGVQLWMFLLMVWLFLAVFMYRGKRKR